MIDFFPSAGDPDAIVSRIVYLGVPHPESGAYLAISRCEPDAKSLEVAHTDTVYVNIVADASYEDADGGVGTRSGILPWPLDIDILQAHVAFTAHGYAVRALD